MFFKNRKNIKKQSALQMTALILTAVFAIVMGACAADEIASGGAYTGEGSTASGGSSAPVVGDYNISNNLKQTVGNVTAVTVIKKDSNRSPGAVTVHYEGLESAGTDYEKSQELPEDVGSYAVTFDVAQATGWEAAHNLPAGTLVIGYPIPAATDFEFNNLNQLLNSSITAVTITPKEGKSEGDITVYYNGSTSLPSAEGRFPVTFDVAEADGWQEAKGLSAGDLIIGNPLNQSPAVADYSISTNRTQTKTETNTIVAVTVTARDGKSSGAVTVHYEGIDGTNYSRSTAVPQQPGKYAITFDVAAAAGWNSASMLSAGTLTIIGTPVAGDFDVSNNLSQTVGEVTAVTVTKKDGKSHGHVTVYYTGINGTNYAKNTAVPSIAGTFSVTFDVAVDEVIGVWNAVQGLTAGTLTIANVIISSNANIRAVSGDGASKKYGLYIGGMPGTSNGDARSSETGFTSTTITVSGNSPSMQTTRKAVVIVEDDKVSKVEFALTSFTNGSSITASNLNLSGTVTWNAMSKDDEYSTPDTAGKRWTSAIGATVPSQSGYRAVYVRITAQDGTVQVYRYVQYISTTATNNTVTRGELSALSIGGVAVITSGAVQSGQSKGIALGWWNRTVAPDLEPGNVTITAAQAASCAVTATANQGNSGFSVSIAKISASQWPLLENSDFTFGYTGSTGTNPQGSTTFTNVQNGDYIIIRQNANTSDSIYGGLFTHTIIRVTVQ